MKSSWGKRLFLVFRLAVAVGLLWWVFHAFIKPDEIRALVKGTSAGLLVLGLCTELVPIFVTTLRWQILLRPVGLRLGFLRVLHYNYLGLFFNNFLIGLTGGDLVKAILITRGTDRRAAAALTVFVDRLIGLVVLAAIAGAACFARIGNRDFLVAAAIVWGFLGSFLLFCLLYFNRRLRAAQWVRHLRRALPGRGLLVELDAAGRAYRGQWGILAASVLLSIAGHAASIGGAYILALALGARVSFVDVVIYFPVVMMIASVPISIGSWGVGEAAFVGFFRKVGMPDATAVGLSLLVRLAQAVWTLPGGLLLVIDPAERKAVKEAEAEANRESAGPPAK